MRQFYELLAATFKMTVRNRQALFWLFVFPVMLMALYVVAFSGGQAEPKLGLIDLDNSSMSRQVTKGFKTAKIIKLSEPKSVKEGKEKLKKGDLDGVIVLGAGLSSDVAKVLAARPGSVAGGSPAKIDLYFDPSNTFVSEVTKGLVGNVISSVDRSASGAPVLMQLRSHSVRQRNLRYIDFLVPGIIAMTLMNSAMFGLGGTIVNYRERGILRRLKVTPQPLALFVGAQIANQLIFSVIRAVLLIAVARALFGVTVVGNWFLLFLVVIVGSLAFVTIAFAIASFAKNREIADTLGNLISMPMMFLGGVFFPTDGAPSWIKPLINAMPLKYLADAMRGVMIKGDAFSTIQTDLLVLVGVTLVFFVISSKLWRWE